MTKKIKIQPSKIFLLICLIIVTILFVSPIFWMISASFQGQGELFKIPFSWIPKQPSLDNYLYSIKIGGIAQAFKVSIIVSIMMIIIQVSLSTITGYVFCKYQFRWKNFILLLILMTIMIPQEITFMPLFDIIRSLKLTNTYIGMIFPFLYSGFGIIYIMQFSKYIPDSMIEAATIEGVGHIKRFVYIVLPQLKSAISGLIILAFTFIWSEFAWSRVVISKESMRPLSIVLTQLSKGYDNYINYGALIASGVMVMIPILLIFLFFQKNFVKSVMNSGIKG